MSVSENNTIKKNKSNKFSGFLILVVLAAIVFVVNSGILSPQYDTDAPRDKMPVVYVKDGILNVRPVNKRASKLSDFLNANDESATGYASRVALSETGNSIYFLENFNEATHTGTLYASYNGKTKIPVAYNVLNNIKICQKGDHALYIANPDFDTMTGTLYIHKKGEERKKIADNVGLDDFLFTDDDCKAFMYLSKEAIQHDIWDLYYADFKGYNEKVDSGVRYIVNLYKTNEAIYTKANALEEQAELYYWKKSRPSVKIASNVIVNNGVPCVYTTKISPKLYFLAKNEVTSSNDLWHANGKKSAKIIAENVSLVLNNDSENANIIYTKDFSDYISDSYVKLKNKTVLMLTQGQHNLNNSIDASYNFRNIAFLTNIDPTKNIGQLRYKKTGMFSDKTDVIIADSVSAFAISQKGNVLAYVTSASVNEAGSLYVYKNNKSEFVAGNVLPSNFKLAENGNCLYYLDNFNTSSNSGNLYIKKLSIIDKKLIKLDSNVMPNFYPRNDKNIVYMKDYDVETGSIDLYFSKTNGKTELVDTGCITVLLED